MIGNSFAFSRIKNAISPDEPHRDSAGKFQTLCLRVTGAVVRQRVGPYELLLRSLALSRLAAAEAKIAELESALREADKRVTAVSSRKPGTNAKIVEIEHVPSPEARVQHRANIR